MTSTVTRRERKVVSVLFCDLVGFTARAESLDPEDVEAILRPYHDRVRTELERHGGTVEKFIGDAVMALFGAPTAHEDDPERAVRAALTIRDAAIDVGLELRIGITTGEALIALDADPASGQAVAAGDVVNTAARLQAAAPVNGIVVDEATYRATREVITYEPAPPVEAKGKAEPVQVWLAHEARSRFGVDVAHKARTPLVGRDRELAILREAFERARHDRLPQLVTLVGVPGIGKSRLIFELSRIVDDDPELITWRQGRCLAYGDGVAFWALAEVVKAQAGISETDAEDEVATKLRVAVADAALGERDAAWVESHLRSLVGLETDTRLGEDRRGEAFAAWRRYLEGLADQGPFVLVIEDLHWADSGLLDFVEELVDWLTDLPLLVVASARPELLDARPGWGGGKLNASTVGLSALSDTQTARLIAEVLERPLQPAEVQHRLIERAGGNPLYAEQFARLYLERGSGDEIPLPETLQGIVAARIDALRPAEKSLLQDGAVMGKVFWTSAVHEDHGHATPILHGLERKGFLARGRRSSVEGEDEWAFGHMLLRDVAYGQIPRAERAAKHRRAAEWIAGLGRPDDHAELLAFHWRSSLDLARAAGQPTGDLEDPTRRALRAAGDRAFAVHGYQVAADHYRQALVLWPTDDAERPRLLHRYADALVLTDDDAVLGALEVARDALVAVDDREAAAECEISIAQVLWGRGQTIEAATHLHRAAALINDRSSRAAVRVLAAAARKRVIGGDLTDGLSLATEALRSAEALGDAELTADALATIGIAKWDLGDATGEHDERRALELAVAADTPLASSIANNVATLVQGRYDLRQAHDLFEEAYRIAERFGDRAGMRWLDVQRAWTSLMTGHWDESLVLLDGFLVTSDGGSPHYLEPGARWARGSIRAARGDSYGASVDNRRGMEVLRTEGDPQQLLPDLGTAVLILETEGRVEEARSVAADVVELARAHPEGVSWSFPIDFLFTQVALEHKAAIRDVVRAARPNPGNELVLAYLDGDFDHAADLWAGFGSPTWEARCRLRAAEDLIAAGRRPEAEAQAARAVEFYRSVGASALVDRCQALVRPAKTA
jgi:class 3 adenylate cyclase/predicted ATPase